MCGDDQEELPSSVAEELILYAETTSLTGPAQVVGARQRWVKLFWLLAFLGMVCLALYQVHEVVEKYLRYEVATEVILKSSTREQFPSVTICNLNPMEQSKLDAFPKERDMMEMYRYPDEYEKLNATQRKQFFYGDHYGHEDGDEDEESPIIDPACTAYNNQKSKGFDYDDYDEQNYKNDPNDFSNGEDNEWDGKVTDEEMELAERCQDKVKESKFLVTDLLKEKLATMKWTRLQGVSQKREAFIVDCIFNGTRCTARDFKEVRSNRYGICVQFPKDNEIRITNSPGPSNGLTLLLFLNTDEYTFAENSGARIDVHGPKAVSYPYENGFYVEPGKMNSIGIRKIVINRLSAPYGECIENKTLETDYPHIQDMKERNKDMKTKDYSIRDCKMICTYEEIKEKCKCLYITTPLISPNTRNGLDFCTEQDKICFQSVLRNSMSGNFSGACGNITNIPKNTTQQCPNPCSQTDYLKEISTSQYPPIHNFAEIANILRKNKATQQFFNLPTPEDFRVEGDQVRETRSSRPGQGVQTIPVQGNQNRPGQGNQTRPGQGDQTRPGQGDQVRKTYVPVNGSKQIRGLSKSWYDDNEWFNMTARQEFEQKVIQNIVKVNLFYKELNYEAIKQKPNYEEIQLISDIGGNTGLWMGFCVLTLVEWFVLLVNICYVFCCNSRTKSKTSPGDKNGLQETIKL